MHVFIKPMNSRGVSAAAKLSAQPTSEEREIELVRASMEQVPGLCQRYAHVRI